MPATFTLGKEERLKSRKATDQLFRQGRRFTISPFRVLYIMKEGKGLKFGVGAGTRNFNRAVDRNRIKRITREAWRLQKISLNKELAKKNMGMDVFLLYTEKEILPYEIVSKKISLIITKLFGLLHENDPAHT